VSCRGGRLNCSRGQVGDFRGGEVIWTSRGDDSEFLRPPTARLARILANDDDS
jgi:hypothetical protein